MGNIVIDRYDDRIVMSNPGTMLVSLEDFWEGGHSVCRNPLLQKMFVFVGVGEKAGSGADIIGTGWRENGWQLPTLVEHQMPARVEASLLIEDLVKQQERETIQKSGLETESNQKSDQKTGLETENHTESNQKSGLEIENHTESNQKSGLEAENHTESGLKSVQKTENHTETIQKGGQKTEDHTENHIGLSRIQCEIIEKLKENPAYSRRELAIVIENASLGGVISALSRLQKLGIIRHIGPDKGGHWEIVAPSSD